MQALLDFREDSERSELLRSFTNKFLRWSRLAVTGGTSASGAGGCGTEALGSAAMNLDVDIAAVSAMLFLQTS